MKVPLSNFYVLDPFHGSGGRTDVYEFESNESNQSINRRRRLRFGLLSVDLSLTKGRSTTHCGRRIDFVLITVLLDVVAFHHHHHLLLYHGICSAFYGTNPRTWSWIDRTVLCVVHPFCFSFVSFGRYLPTTTTSSSTTTIQQQSIVVVVVVVRIIIVVWQRIPRRLHPTIAWNIVHQCKAT
jgi:hypothetical protein